MSVSPLQPAMAEGLHEDMQAALLHESDDNPRFITDEAFERLVYSMQKDPSMLKARPVVCNEWGEVICGNMRLRAAKQLGWRNVPTYVHYFRDEAEKREWMLRDNQEYGQYVPDLVAQMIATHAAEGADTKLLGFSDDEVLAAVRRATGDAIVPEPSESPKQELASECMVEIRCTSEALGQIMSTLEAWEESIDDLSVAVTQ